MAASPARQLAFHVLAAVEGRGAQVGALMRGAEAERCSLRDRALALELALGVLRHRTQLDFLTTVAARRAVKDMPPPVRIALWLGLYQLRFLSRIPAVAAVHESVELAKLAGPRAAGFVNAVLRRAPEASLEALLAREPDPIRRRDIRFSHPGWLLDRWERRWGEAVMQNIATYDNSVPVTVLRAAQPPDATLIADLAAAGVTVMPGRILTSALRVRQGDITHSEPYRSGAVAIQDEASQLIPYLLEPAGAASILDLCAAPGGKAAILAALAPGARLIAVERYGQRARALRRRLPPAIAVIVADAERSLPLRQKFERVLVDAPCSGTGTLQRNPEIRWRLQPEDLVQQAVRQRRMLEQGLAALAPGGRLVYSVCSIEATEGEELVRALLAAHPQLRLQPAGEALQRLEAAHHLVPGCAAALTSGSFLEILPGAYDTEGFFAAIIERKAGR